MVKSFRLGGQKWKVKVLEGSEDNYGGDCCNNTQEIRLYKRVYNTERSADAVESTFYHELAHALLFSIGYDELSCDETLVQGLGNMIHQFTQTKREGNEKR